MNIRLIAFDMDDTLLGANGEFPEINVRALRACAARGIRCCRRIRRNKALSFGSFVFIRMRTLRPEPMAARVEFNAVICK